MSDDLDLIRKIKQRYNGRHPQVWGWNTVDNGFHFYNNENDSFTVVMMGNEITQISGSYAGIAFHLNDKKSKNKVKILFKLLG